MIGERLKEIRKDNKDTQASLARKLNVSLSTVKSWERENSSPNHDIVVAICKMYNVSADFLLGVSDIDPTFSERPREKLNQQSRKLIELFEEFMLYKQSREKKK